MAEDPLCKSPLDTDLSEFLRNQANMAQIEHLQLESGFQSLVRQAMSRRWDKSQELSFPFSRAGKTWEHVVVIASTDLQTWLSATSSLHLVTREGHAANSPSKCCGFLASACSSSAHVSVSRTSNYGYVNPQMLVVNYDNHCTGIFLLSINLTYLDHPGKIVYKAKTCHVFS